MKRTILSTLAVVCMLMLGITAVHAQTLKVDKGLYLKARVGLATYVGDRDGVTGISFQQLQDASWSLGGELGYQFNKYWGLGFGLQVGEYTKAVPPGYNYKIRWTGMALLRRTFQPDASLSPYVHFGLNVTTGYSNKTGFGPTLGAGLDIAITDGASLFFEATSNAVFPDDAADGSQTAKKNFDLLNFLGLGLRVGPAAGRYGASLSEPSKWFSRCTPVEIASIEGPQRFDMGKAVSFRAVLNADASEPVEVTWDFGDGATAMGTEVSHTFEVPQGQEQREFTITVRASNCGGEILKTFTVTVINPCPYPAEIVSMTATPTNPREGDVVRFSAEVRGTTPVVYRWNFGDGITSSEPNPSHTYADAGTYTVTLEISNCGGTDRRTITVVVTPPPIELIELNAVYFNFRSSRLTDEAKAILMENVAELKKYPEVCVRIDAYTDHVEARGRRAQRLSEARAKAVEQFYLDQGIPASRIVARGLGQAPVSCAKEDPGPGCRRNRRAESVPINCEDVK